jgi:hypothetical protein
MSGAGRPKVFELRQNHPSRLFYSCTMTVVFTCPKTGLQVQAWLAALPCDGAGETYQSVKCIACGGVHLVHPKNGKVLAVEEQQR